MDMTWLLQHTFCGCVSILPGAALFVCLRQRLGKKQTGAHIAALLLFCCYLAGALSATGLCLSCDSFAPRISWIPFRDMVAGPVDTFLNVLLFLPFGFLLPLLYRDFAPLRRTAAAGLLFSLSIELIQLFGLGSTDSNDLITNTVGACLGYGCYAALSRCVAREARESFWAAGLRDRAAAALLLLYAVGMMLTVSVRVCHALF